jgi:hypothetical protein
MTAVTVGSPAYQPSHFAPDLSHVAPDLCEQVIVARSHRAAGAEDLCRICDWHWPCPAYFWARRLLITAGVPPSEWA